ncbi:maleylpyruvate isomerase family mycothiol-dependent enzyme [Nocardia salmonicida]|uniref:maleylpyruvate isomerase family mycothiol-dependent enzyme n=1 Tax=Nocardia salmonicida TaxID=53431 RepID=UPI0033D590F9
MDREQQWQVIEQQRRAVADLLADLTPPEWDSPSLCAGWRVRDVAAHLAMAPQPPGPAAMIRMGIRAGGRFHRMNHDAAVRYSDRPDLSGEIRAHAASRRLPAVTNYRNIFFDVIVHAQDIARPLGRTIEVTPRAAAVAAQRVWTMGWPFWAKRHLRGLHLAADDIEWSTGAGIPVHGPILDLLLAMTGRSVAVANLHGPGVQALSHSLR